MCNFEVLEGDGYGASRGIQGEARGRLEQERERSRPKDT